MTFGSNLFPFNYDKQTNQKMNPAQNIVIALFLTIQLGIGENRIYIKPSVFTLPEIIFTNQANYELSKKNKIPRTDPPAIRIYHKNNVHHPEKSFQVKVTMPDLVAVFHRGNGLDNYNKKIK